MDWGSAGAIVGLCLAGVIGFYLLSCCVSLPILSRTRASNDDRKVTLKDERFKGATLPHRPAHVQAADAKRYAEEKANERLKDSSDTWQTNPAYKSSSDNDEMGPGEALLEAYPIINASASPVIVMMPPIKQHYVSRRVSFANPIAREAGHVAIDPLESERAEEGGSTGLIRLALDASTPEDGDSSSVSLKLNFRDPADTPVNSSFADVSSTTAATRSAPDSELTNTPVGISGVTAAATDSAGATVPAAAHAQTETDSAGAGAVTERVAVAATDSIAMSINDAVDALSLPGSPVAIDGSLGATKSEEMEYTTAISGGVFGSPQNTPPKAKGGFSNPLFLDSGSPPSLQ